LIIKWTIKATVVKVEFHARLNRCHELIDLSTANRLEAGGFNLMMENKSWCMTLTLMHPTLYTGYAVKIFQIKMVIRLRTKNLGTIVTANDNMLRLAGNHDSWETCHKIDPKKQLGAIYLVFNC
jgi:hypothetical protein